MIWLAVIGAVEAFVARPGHHVRRDDDAFVRLRRRVTAGLRELRCGAETLSYPEIARLVGAPNHSTVVGRCQQARRLGLLTESELRTLRNGGAERATA